MTKVVHSLCVFTATASIVLLAENRLDSQGPLDPCSAAGSNPVACENTRPGNPASEWDIVGAGDAAIQGFATDVSVNRGETIHFKIDTTASSARVDIYRLGYYAGLGARKQATFGAVAPHPQPACLTDAATGLVDCGNWSESASWDVPSTAVSGVYVAKLVRTDGVAGSSHIVFVVRDDTRQSDLLFQTSDTTWQAYNEYGGNSLYTGSPVGRAYKVSYNRPYSTRQTSPKDFLFNAEYPMLRWLEANGYDVSYSTGVDTDRRGTELQEHKAFLSVGHDEYWSAGQRAAVEAARAFGVHLAFFSGNEMFWKTRYEPSIDGGAVPYRTLVSYKETHANAKIDPVAETWTGTWRDARFSPPADGGRPENALTGTLFMVNDPASYSIVVPASAGAMRFWRNTSVALLAPGTVATLSSGTLGYEFDEAPADASEPAGLIRLSQTTLSVASKLQDNGSTYAPGTATHSLTLYRDSGSESLVFGAGTIQWSWGLDATHDRSGSAADIRVQQATLNLLADMEAQPFTAQPGLVVSAGTLDTVAPTSTVVFPAQAATLLRNTAITITGTSVDAGGGIVAGVEVSTDGGATWSNASGTSAWSFAWTPATLGQATIMARAVDDSGNVEMGVGGVTVTIVMPPVVCPCTVWPDSTVPPVTDSGPDGSVELGVKFTSDTAGYITALRFYKSDANTGVHVGSLWTNAGTLLSSVTFSNETASGWQTAALPAPIAINANTIYVASYHATDGHYSFANQYFTGPTDNGPLHALASGVSPNGLYRYGSTSLFPNQTFNAANYWVDLVFATSVPDNVPPTVTAFVPGAGATAVTPPAQVTATFSEPMDPASFTAGTFDLRGPGGSVVAGTVSYDDTTLRAIFTPSAALAYSSTFTATVRGSGSSPRATDRAGNPLASDAAWSFTTSAPPPPPPDQGPGGPILVISSPSNPFSRYYAEILHAEGLNAFAVQDLSSVTPSSLASYDLVVLGEMPLTPSQVTMLTTWVNGGGRLVAMRPDKQLASLIGVADAQSTLSDQYLLLNTASGPGAGLVNQTMQFHGTADQYTLAGATSLATLYSTDTTATTRPAVTLRQVGSNGGQVAAFTYDLARSVVYTRQGNPAWAGLERDGQSPIRSNDLFVGNTALQQADWVDMNKVAIPQADEQQRMLANLILQMNSAKKPLPRFWYFPGSVKAVVIMTGDDHANGGTAGRFDRYVAASAPNCSVDDWQCVRSTSYIYPSTPLPDSTAAAYRALGFEIGLHVTTTCQDYTPQSLTAAYADQLTTWRAKYGSLPTPATNRTHCIVWSDYATQPQLEFNNGIRLDTTYYYWPSTWILDRPGMFTGSGMPMRFATSSGAMIDVYQAATQMTDESGQTFPLHVDALLDGALGPNGYYGAFVANMHTDAAASAGSDAILASALSRNVPVISAQQMLQWLDGRNASTFKSLNWAGTVLTFSIEMGGGSRGLRAMLPYSTGINSLVSLTADGAPVSFVREVIKGVEYAIFPATPSAYVATYDPGPPDTTITARPPADSSSTSATFQFSSTLPGTFQCSLDGAAFTTCVTGVSYSGLAQGAHTFAVRAVSASGVIDATPASYGWTIDTTPPVLAVVMAVPAQVVSVITWTTNEPADSLVQFGTSASSLTGQVSDTAMLTSHTLTVTGLTAGTTYYYRLTSRNAAGLSGYSPSSTTASTFATIVAPDTTITASPASVTSATSATFQFTATQAGTFECSRDGAAFAVCTTPLTYSSLAAGGHTFKVRAVSTSGVADPVPASFSWTIDLTAPAMTSVAASTTQTTATVTWTTSEASDSVIDYGTSSSALSVRASNASMVTSHSLTLTGLTANTTYYYRITSKDTAGNQGYSPSSTGSSTFKTAAPVAPDTAITATPAAVTSSTSATFQFTSTIAGSTFQCSRDGAAYATCTTPVSYTGLTAGSHTFSVRAIAAGLTDGTPATYSWTIDTTAPVLSSIGVTPSLTSATIAFATNEVADAQIDYGTSASSLSSRVTNASMVLNHSMTLSGLNAGTTYYYRITSKNAAGLSGYAPSSTGSSTFVTRTQVSQAPNSTTISAGSVRSGSSSNLSGNDGSYYQVYSTMSGSARTASWYGSFTGVTNSLRNLAVTYSGFDSTTVTQVVEIFNFTTNAWVSLNSRSVGTTEVTLTGLAPASGTAPDYVSGTSGTGEVRVRVRATGGSSTFYSSGDQLRIAFDRP